MSKKRLGTNLNALLGGANLSKNASEELAQPTQAVTSNVLQLPVDLIVRGKYQPRRDMHPDALEELSESIKAQGVLQPIVVRPIDKKRYEIIAGERRWRASQLAGLSEIPVVVKDVEDDAAIAMALIENIQREDLNPIEEALALSRLQKEFNLTQVQVAKAVGKSRTAVTNSLRLMSLSDEVKQMLEYSDLEMGHARALLTLGAHEQISAAKTIVANGLSVRQAESLVRRLQQESSKKPVVKKVDPNIQYLENDLTDKIGAKVLIQCNAKGRGKLVISYNSLNELDGILEHIK